MKSHAAAAERNREPILSALAALLGDRASVLEIGSGTGQHAAYFTERMPGWRWQPSDTRAEALASIEAYREESRSAGFLPPVSLDVQAERWPDGAYDAVFSANMIHIAPWAAAVALVTGAARVLGRDGKLVLYGPFRFHGELSPESNQAFDRRLRSENGAWGIRDVIELGAVARPLGFGEAVVQALPANNHVLVFEKRAQEP